MSYIQLPYGEVKNPQKTIKLTGFRKNYNVCLVSQFVVSK